MPSSPCPPMSPLSRIYASVPLFVLQHPPGPYHLLYKSCSYQDITPRAGPSEIPSAIPWPTSPACLDPFVIVDNLFTVHYNAKFCAVCIQTIYIDDTQQWTQHRYLQQMLVTGLQSGKQPFTATLWLLPYHHLNTVYNELGFQSAAGREACTFFGILHDLSNINETIRFLGWHFIDQLKIRHCLLTAHVSDINPFKL